MSGRSRCQCSIIVLRKDELTPKSPSSHHDWTLRVCDNFDWYAPRYQSHHTLDELKTWFVEEGFDNLAELSPAKQGRNYDWSYRHNLLIGSGVNVAGTRGQT